MVDEKVEQETEIKGKAPVETASTVMANPDHPQYTADKAVAKELVNGRTAIIAAIDGVGSGAEMSGKAAELVQNNLVGLESSIIAPPTINQAVSMLKKEIYEAGGEIQELQQSSRDEQVDTTASAGIVCESMDGKKRFLTIANVGDSRIYKYSPKTGEATQLTNDHSLVQFLVETGQISQDEAFTHPQRSVIYRTVGSLKSPDDIDFSVVEIQDGDVFLAVSDGVSDNLTTEKGFLLHYKMSFISHMTEHRERLT